MAPGPTQAKFYDRAVILRMSSAKAYGTDHTGLWVGHVSAIANGSRLSYQVMTGFTGCLLQHGSGVRGS